MKPGMKLHEPEPAAFSTVTATDDVALTPASLFAFDDVIERFEGGDKNRTIILS